MQRGSDFVVLYETAGGTVGRIECGRPIPDSIPQDSMNRVLRVYYSYQTDTVLDVYSYDYWRNVTAPPTTAPPPLTTTATAAPPTSSAPTPAPTLAPTPTGTGAPFSGVDLNINLRGPPPNLFPYPVSPDLLVGGQVDPLLMGLGALEQGQGQAGSGDGGGGGEGQGAPDAAPKDQQAVPESVPAPPEDIGALPDEEGEEGANLLTPMNIIFGALILAALGAAGYYIYKNYVASNSGNAGNGSSAGSAANGGTTANTGTGGNNNFNNFNNFEGINVPAAGGRGR